MSQSEHAVYAQLAATTAVTALVGTNIEPQAATQTDEYPCVLLSVDSDERGGHHGGADGTATAIVQCDCESTDYDEANAVAHAVTNALSFGRGTWGGIVVQGCFVDDEVETYEYIDNDNQFFGVTIKASLVYEV